MVCVPKTKKRTGIPGVGQAGGRMGEWMGPDGGAGGGEDAGSRLMTEVNDRVDRLPSRDRFALRAPQGYGE